MERITMTPARFRKDFDCRLPRLVQPVWTEWEKTGRSRWLPSWLFPRYRQVERRGHVLAADRVEITQNERDAEYMIRVVYRKTEKAAGGNVLRLMANGISFANLDGGPTLRFSDFSIREKLQQRFGRLPPPRGNYICTVCGLDTGDEDFCSGCQAPSYWEERGGGCRYASETVHTLSMTHRHRKH